MKTEAQVRKASQEQRRRQWQKIIFSALAVILIVSWILSLMINV